MVATLTIDSSDGTDIRAFDEGQGPLILVLHAARESATAWQKVAARLSGRFRVVRLQRRQHRQDLGDALPCSIADEVADVLALLQVTGSPAVIVGHSSGGVVALEAMVSSPSAFAGAILYEPPVIIGPPLGGEALRRAQATYAAGKQGKALEIFLRDVVDVRPPLARLVGTAVGLSRTARSTISHQLDDCKAVDDLGLRLGAYADITVPTVLLGGSRSPAQFSERMTALARVMLNTERVVMAGRGHYANILRPSEVAQVIARHTDKVLS
jgi:pimeloyl-ACP methyl ester carboxylesterase